MGRWRSYGNPTPRFFTISLAARAVVVMVGLLLLTAYFQWPASNPGLSITPTGHHSSYHASGRVIKVSMLYGAGNTLYERAIRTHQRHAERWGHSLQVLRQDLATGFWNKPTYILHVLTQELIKEPADRAEWLMWVDADSIIINPDIAPELFLPPSDLSQLHFVGTRDPVGLNTGVFYLRVSAWSVSFLVETLAMPLYDAEYELGRSADQEAMCRVLSKTKGGPEGRGYRDGVVLVPRTWINTYEWHHAYEGKRGDMLVHFPGLEAARWKHMADWLDIVETKPEKWQCALQDTNYWNITRDYWKEYRSAFELMTETERLQSTEVFNDGIRAAAEDLKTILETKADDIGKVHEAKKQLQAQRKGQRAS